MLCRSVALALAVGTSTAFAEGAVTSTFDWTDPVAMGVSGLDVLDDNASFVAVTDRGWFLEGQFEWTDGTLSAVSLSRVRPILDPDGRPTAARRLRDWADAEGLTFATDGSLIVGFERWMHVGRFADTAAVQEVLVGPAAFRDFTENRQIEAVATHPDGRIFAWPERPLMGDRFHTFVYEDGTWSGLDPITEEDGFSIVGADFAKDGNLYLLERKLILGRWWQNRVRRVTELEFNAPEILWTGGRGDFYNLEGLAVLDGSPRRLILIGDNNNREDTPADIVEITLTD